MPDTFHQKTNSDRKKQTIRCFIGIGSNLNNPVKQIMQAIEALHHLSHTTFIQASSLYQTLPVGPTQPDFINAVAELNTTLTAENLLQALQQIEQAQGRIRTIRWGPRTLDLDLLLYGNARIVTAGLTVPHPGLYQRKFVLEPLHEIAPDLILPNGQALMETLQKLVRISKCNGYNESL